MEKEAAGDQFFIAQLSFEKGKEWFESLSLEGVSFAFKLDSGASCYVLPKQSFVHLPAGIQLKPGPRVRNYGEKGGYLEVMGVATLKVEHKNKSFLLDFVVVDEPGQPPILGLPSCEQMDLIRRVDAIAGVPPTPEQLTHPILEEFKDILCGLGKLPVEQHIRLATGPNRVDPSISAAAHLPFSLEKKVFKTLDDMIDQQVLKVVTKPTEWCSRMVVVGKPNGDVRICMDTSELNKAILRPHCAVPTAAELFSRLNKARYFCNLDAASGFFKIPLSEESSYLCTMATPRGRVRFLRMPFGLVSAPEVYVQVMQQMFGDRRGCHIYVDDFLVEGETMAELLVNLRGVFIRCREVNLK